MSPWLKTRLLSLLCGALLVGGATYLHAQSDYPAPAQTPEEAGTRFFQLLSSLHGDWQDLQNSAVNTAVDDRSIVPTSGFGVPAGLQNGTISRVQFNSFNTSPFRLNELMDLLFAKTVEPQYEGRVTSTEGGRSLVEVSPSRPRAREVVVIAEDGGYRVDLKATFAKWNNLSGEKLDEEWYRYTGAVSPAMSKSSNFLKSQCQSLMKQQMLGIIQYTQDYDEVYPPARKWMDVVQPYIGAREIYRCPSLPRDRNGYAYVQYLSQIPVARVENMSQTINVYETSNPKRNWFGPGTGRAYRHQGGWNLAFADGHVKWFKEGQPTNISFKPKLSWNPSASSSYIDPPYDSRDGVPPVAPPPIGAPPPPPL